MKKRFAFLTVCMLAFTLLLSALFSFTPISTPVHAQTERMVGGMHGENIVWTLNLDTGELCLDGEGEVLGFSNEDVFETDEEEKPSWLPYRKQVKSLRLSDKITILGRYAFYECYQIEEVELCGSLTQIDEGVFAGVEHLQSVRIGAQLFRIGMSAFGGCSRIKVAYVDSSSAYDLLFTHDELAHFHDTIKTLAIAKGVQVDLSVQQEFSMVEEIAYKGITYTARSPFPHRHEWDTYQIASDTCLRPGFDGFICIDEKCLLKRGDSVYPHTYEYTKDNAETHTALCSTCQDTQAQLPHEWTLTSSTPSTHLKEGEESYLCEPCQATKTITLERLPDHTYGDWIEMENPTCTKQGEEKRTCACGAWQTQSIAALDHDYKIQVVPATCVQPGYTQHACNRCDDVYRTDETNALGHSYDNEQDATCNTCGAVRSLAGDPPNQSSSNTSSSPGDSSLDNSSSGLDNSNNSGNSSNDVPPNTSSGSGTDNPTSYPNQAPAVDTSRDMGMVMMGVGGGMTASCILYMGVSEWKKHKAKRKSAAKAGKNDNNSQDIE